MRSARPVLLAGGLLLCIIGALLLRAAHDNADSDYRDRVAYVEELTNSTDLVEAAERPSVSPVLPGVVFLVGVATTIVALTDRARPD